MIVEKTPLQGALLLTAEPIRDSRGYFARSFCKKTLIEHDVFFEMVQSNIAFNQNSKTTRGMHFQLPPFSEAKIVACSHGSVYDVIIDLNSNSSTYGKWFGVLLSDQNNRSLYIPKGFAHGYQTLSDNSMLHYMVDEYYAPKAEAGIRWNDPSFNIKWPFVKDLIISEKDKNWADFKSDNGLL